MIETDYAIQFDDYKAAHRLWLLDRPGAMLWHLFVMWILPGVVVCANCWSLWLWIRQRNDVLPTMYGFTIALTWLCLILILTYRRRLRRRYKEATGGAAAQRVRLVVDNAHVSVSHGGRAETRFSWNAIEKFLEDERGSVLVAGKMWVVIPRRALNEAQWAELRGMAAAKVARAG
jgi:drug/metabolite transporter superfamily protein YnfA